jgi:hypothetical protein
MEMEQDDRGGNIYRVTDKGKELSKHLNLVMGFLELRDSDEA